MKLEFETMSDITIYERPSVSTMSLSDIQSIFYLFSVGTMLSIIVAILECLIKHLKGKFHLPKNQSSDSFEEQDAMVFKSDDVEAT